MSFLRGWFGGSTEAKEAPKVREAPVAPNDVYFCRPKLNPNFLLPKFLTDPEQIAKTKPPAVVKTWDARYAELQGKEKEAYDQMAAALGEDIVKQQTGWALLRYLVARQWKVEEAAKLLQSTLVWRKTLPNFCKWCNENPNSHMAEFVGWDKQHRPVIWMTYRYAVERGDPVASEHHMSSAFDHACRMMPEGVTQWVTMVDFTHFSILKDSSPSVAKKIIGVLADHFPERLGCFILVNPVRGTWAFWKALSAFIDQRTKDKVRFAYSNGDPPLKDVFEELFPPALAKWLIARYMENYKNVDLGSLEDADVASMAAVPANPPPEGADAAASPTVKVANLNELDAVLEKGLAVDEPEGGAAAAAAAAASAEGEKKD